jgi:hypothetical protein
MCVLKGAPITDEDLKAFDVMAWRTLQVYLISFYLFA